MEGAQDLAPERAAPGRAASEGDPPHRAAPGRAVPGRAAFEGAAPGRAVPGRAEPFERTADEGLVPESFHPGGPASTGALPGYVAHARCAGGWVALGRVGAVGCERLWPSARALPPAQLTHSLLRVTRLHVKRPC